MRLLTYCCGQNLSNIAMRSTIGYVVEVKTGPCILGFKCKYDTTLALTLALSYDIQRTQRGSLALISVPVSATNAPQAELEESNLACRALQEQLDRKGAEIRLVFACVRMPVKSSCPMYVLHTMQSARFLLTFEGSGGSMSILDMC
jgi:hypothetical protein